MGRGRRDGAVLRAAGLVLGLALLSCGDAVVERGFRGEALFTFTGEVASVNSETTFDHPLRAALFWSADGRTALDGPLVEETSIGVAVRFPGIFEINVFEPPPEVAWTDPAADYRVGLVLVYEDVDGDGAFQPAELRGGARNIGLFYVERDIAAADSPSGVAMAAGFRAQRLPMHCMVAPTPGATGCSVPLGDPCATDADCMTDGVCLTRDEHHHWPGGYCAQRHNPGGCNPAGARALRTETSEGVREDLWYRPCSTSNDCRVQDGYECEDGACLPGEPAAFVLDPMLEISPLCAADEMAGD